MRQRAFAALFLALVAALPPSAAARDGPTFVATMQHLDLWSVPPEARLESVETPNGAVARMAGVPLSPAPGGMPGISLVMPAWVEAAAQGRRVEVEVVARRAGEKSAAAFAVGYSTNDVGNSGWRTFQLTNDFQTFSFRYQVPPINEGRLDFVGILPDADGEGGAVEIAEVRVTPIGLPPDVATGFYDLDIARQHLPSAPSGSGGLAMAGEVMVYAAPDGRLLRLDPQGEAPPVDTGLRVPVIGDHLMSRYGGLLRARLRHRGAGVVGRLRVVRFALCRRPWRRLRADRGGQRRLQVGQGPH